MCQKGSLNSNQVAKMHFPPLDKNEEDTRKGSLAMQIVFCPRQYEVGWWWWYNSFEIGNSFHVHVQQWLAWWKELFSSLLLLLMVKSNCLKKNIISKENGIPFRGHFAETWKRLDFECTHLSDAILYSKNMCVTLKPIKVGCNKKAFRDLSPVEDTSRLWRVFFSF